MSQERTDYPLSLDLTARRVLVVGGGPVAARKVRGLLAAGAGVDVVAPRLADELSGLAASGVVRWSRRAFQPDDLLEPEPAWLVHTATGIHAVDAAVASGCEAERIWCVRADDASASRASTPAVARGQSGSPAEGLSIAVTGDADPRRAVAVRDALAAALASGALPVRRHRVVSPGASRDESPVGRVALVGGGPGDPDLITVRGRLVLAAADVVVADRLGPRELLDSLPAQVEVVDVGKSPGHHPISQDRINELLVEHALAGKDVVRLKGGDPFVLGRGGEEALYCASYGIPVEVVPGVTSAVSVPAAAGIPVTHRGITASFVVASAHDGAHAALDALRDAPVSSTLVLLMGITSLASTAGSLIANGRSADTPVALIESGWTPQQRTTVTTLGDAAFTAAREGVRSPAVVVVGDVVSVREQLGDLRRPVLAARQPLVLLAHGSPDPRHAQGVEAVVEQVRRRWRGPVHAAYLDHHGPSPVDVGRRLSGSGHLVVAPLLLTAAYHVRVDVPSAAKSIAETSRGEVAVAAALGPDPLLFTAAEELLGSAEISQGADTAVVLCAGGSSDRDAIAAIADLVAARRPAGWGPWAVAALAGGEPLPSVVARLRTGGAQQVAVVSYMVAEGVLRDRMASQAAEAGATMVPGALGSTAALAALVVRRAAAAASTG